MTYDEPPEEEPRCYTNEIEGDNKKTKDLERAMLWVVALFAAMALTGLFYIIFKIE